MAAVECGQAVEEILAHHYGEDLAWLKQAKDGTVAFIQRCITQLGGSPGPQQNAGSLADGAQYTHPARTAQQIRETPAADEGNVSRAPRRFRTDDPVDTVQQRGELADPVEPTPATPPRRIIVPKQNGWSL